ncbi:MAG: carboxypeptidase M32 [Candidatus Heimdallarchaeota archaeon]|nr:carboxypeptidase M32 [Candidatus Heimdallarchaeota archaeon]
MNKFTALIYSYLELMEYYQEIINLQNTQWLLHWDLDTFMPKKALKQKTGQLAVLSDIIHKRKTSSEVFTLLNQILNHRDYCDLSSLNKRNVYLIKKEYDKLTKIPAEIEKAFVKQRAITYEKWQIAKKKANFKIYLKEQIELIELVKERARYLDPSVKTLDVLMDQHEPGLNLEIMDKTFDELKKGLIPILKACMDSSNQPDLSLILRYCPIPIQKEIALDQVKVVGFKGGRVDVSVHPITYGYYDDVRITTRYNENDFTDSFYSVMHESGHALYNQNYPPDYKWQPAGSACSGGMHEGMARFVENMIGRNPSFWEFYLPRLKKITGKIFEDVELEQFIYAVNNVRPSKTRVGADEVTYTLHLIFRMEIEKDLFDEKIRVSELPNVWNEKMKEYFNIEITNDAEGVLQDMHWPYAAFGYFPNFAFGNIYGGQLLWKMKQEIQDWESVLGKGQISTIIDWLQKNIYHKGNLMDPQVLIEKVTGKPISPKYFIDYLHEKYSKLYEF